MPPRVDVTRLPRTDEHFVGREDELARLDEAWTDGKNAFSIVALGGVGKTALVQHWLGRLSERHFDDARVYAWTFYSQGTDEGRLASADSFVDHALRHFGDPDPTAGSARDRGLRLAELVRTERTLLVLDGLEPLQHPPTHALAGRVKDLALAALLKSLAAENNGICLVTTREKVDELVPFTETTAPRLDLEHLKPDDGVDFLRRLGVRGTDAELRLAVEEFDGHALALRLLGNFLVRVYDGEVHRRDQVPILTADAWQGGHAFRVMAAYETRLDGGRELSILRLLGLFDRPASGDSVQALLKLPAIPNLTEALVGLDGVDWKWALANLRDYGLIAAMDADDRGGLDAHPLVRAYFAEVLKNRFPEAWRAGHLRLYEHLCAKAPDLPATLPEMTPLFAAVVHGCHAGRQQEAYREVYRRRIHRQREYYSWRKLGAFGSELTVLAAFFDRPWDRPSEDLKESEQGSVLNYAGFYLRALGRLTEAYQPMLAVLELRRQEDDWKNAAINAGNFSELHLMLGEVGQAVALAEEGIRLADQSGDSVERTVVRTVLADALHQAGERAKATEVFRKAEEMWEVEFPTSPRLTGLAGYRYCDLLLSLAEHNGRQDTLRRGKEILEEAQRRDIGLDLGLAHVALGRAHFALVAPSRASPNNGGQEEELDLAAKYLNKAVDLLRQAAHEDHLPSGLLARAAFRRTRSDRKGALADLDEAEEIALRGQMRLYECDVHLERARLAITLGRPGEARERLERSRRLIEKTGYHRRDEDVLELEMAVRKLSAKPLPGPPKTEADLGGGTTTEPRRERHVRGVHPATAARVDLVIEVTTPLGRPGHEIFEYKLDSPSNAIDLFRRFFRGEPLQQPSSDFQERLFHRLESLHRGLDTDGDAILEEDIPDELDALGRELYDQLFPSEVRQILSEVRGTVKTVLVVSDEPWIPWEMVKPDGGDFLAADFQVTRWLAGAPRPAALVQAHQLACFDAGTERTDGPRLPNTKTERAFLGKLAADVAGLVDRSPTQPTFRELNNLLGLGEVDLLHFAGHGDYDEKHPDKSRILLADRAFRVHHLRDFKSQLRKKRPFVFLNACEAGRQGQSLTGLGGWAKWFINDCGCSVFVGPQWAVRDSLAHRVAEILYDELRQGQTFGKAAQSARLKVREEFPADPGWLAYTLYAHPNGLLLLGSEDPETNRVAGKKSMRRVPARRAAALDPIEALRAD